MSSTFDALLARGIDSDTASRLDESKLTLAKLKVMSVQQLENLGLAEEFIDIIHNESRPPIPSETVTRLLHESKWVCCVCRGKSKGIIIHHIDEWSESRNHSEKNLVVLCLEHHDLAHTRKSLTTNLSKEKLRELKQLWLKKVELTDTNIIRGLAASEESSWYYFNHSRIFELYQKYGISNKRFKNTDSARSLNLISDLGFLNLVDDDKSQMYDFGNNIALYLYVEEVFDEVIKQIPLIDLTPNFNKSFILSLIKSGVGITLKATFYFKSQTKIKKGRGQRRLCYYHKDKVRIEFEFDAYESTSNSSWSGHLRGRKEANVIGFVTSLVEEDAGLIMTIRCLAIGFLMEMNSYTGEDY